MKRWHTSLLAGLALVIAFAAASPALARAKKPNMLFIMGGDIGLMQLAVYHRRLMVGPSD